MKGIQELFSDAGFNSINSSRVKKSLIEKKIMRIPKGLKTSLEFIPSVFRNMNNSMACFGMTMKLSILKVS